MHVQLVNIPILLERPLSRASCHTGPASLDHDIYLLFSSGQLDRGRLSAGLARMYSIRNLGTTRIIAHFIDWLEGRSSQNINDADSEHRAHCT